MTNRGIAIKIKQIVPWWECDGDIYKITLEVLESNDQKRIANIIELIKDYHNSDKIVEELRKKNKKKIKKGTPDGER